MRLIDIDLTVMDLSTVAGGERSPHIVSVELTFLHQHNYGHSVLHKIKVDKEKFLESLSRFAPRIPSD